MFNYEKMLEEIFKILKMEEIIDDTDWETTLGGLCHINIMAKGKVYSFELKDNKENIKITIDTLED